METRTVDLGREDQLVTWGEWFARTGHAMREAVESSMHEHLRYRVTLVDGRVFAVMQALPHVSRGKCSIEKTRWSERDAICNVVTGYLLVGIDMGNNMTAVGIEPDMIASVECVLVRPHEEDDDSEPFGFARFTKFSSEPNLREVDENSLFASVEDTSEGE